MTSETYSTNKTCLGCGGPLVYYKRSDTLHCPARNEIPGCYDIFSREMVDLNKMFGPERLEIGPIIERTHDSS